MKIRLQKKQLLTVYCYLREAERSLHFLMNPARSWDEFLAYYDDDKIRAIRQLSDRLLDNFPETVLNGKIAAPPSTPKPGFFRVVFGPWLNNWKKSWNLPVESVVFPGRCLSALVALLEKGAKPSAESLFQLRLAFSDAERRLEFACYGLKELDVAQHIAHFDQPDTQSALSIPQFLQKVA
ncbi:MAG: hypothetical protein L0215_11760 [Gemmataceae bacterium]|nr:hypothetical protein [Gemmataceae bacterium]